MAATMATTAAPGELADAHDELADGLSDGRIPSLHLSPSPHLAEAISAVGRAIASGTMPFLLLLVGPPIYSDGVESIPGALPAPHVTWIDDAAADDDDGDIAIKLTNLLRTVAQAVTGTKASPQSSVVLSSAAATADCRVRAVCAHIAEVAGVRFVVHVLAPYVWLTRAATPAANASGAAPVPGRWKTAMEAAALEFGHAHASLPSLTPGEWASRVHDPLEYTHGVSLTTTPAYHPGPAQPAALAYRGSITDTATSAALAGHHYLAHEGEVDVKATCARLFREIERGVGEAHLTLMSPQELAAHLEATQLEIGDVIASIEEAALLHADGITEVGMGRVVREDGHWTLFLVYEWPWAQEWRASFGLGPKDLHVTLGFSDQDIFTKADGTTQVSKGASTCLFRTDASSERVTADLVLIRGLPGAGKTSRAMELDRAVCVAADDWFARNGEYTFDPKGLLEAHTWCQDEAISGMKAGLPVVVHNTFTQRWEMQPYLRAATELGLTVTVVSVFDGGCSDEELVRRNTHGVPLAAIQAMRSKWETNWQEGNPLPPWER